MNYKNLSEHQLLKIATTEKTHNKHINIEWRRRFGMNFPYRLHMSGAIENRLIGALVGDRECDRMILEQANRMREERKNELSKTI